MNQIYSCILCNELCDGQQISLTTGKLLHHACHNALKEKLANYSESIARMNSRNIYLTERIRHGNSIFYKFRRLLGGEVINVDACKREISVINGNLRKLLKEKDEITEVVTRLYDYWPSYPPDWEDRKKAARARIRSCERCHSSRGMLHVHHRQPISRGGNHKLDNLIVLCEKCHSGSHGGREFDYQDKIVESSFEKKQNVIRGAIAGQHMLHFSYTRRGGRQSIRTILPSELKNIGNSLCVHGYCYLRKEQRTFAIKRMRNLREVTEPGVCYYK